MNKLVKAVTCILLSSSLVVGSAAMANQSVQIGNVSITGGGMALVGTISTASLDHLHKGFTVVGWTLIVLGILVDNKDLVINTGKSETLPSKEVWGAMVRQSRVLAANPSLSADDVDITNAAKALNLETSTLANMVLDLDRRDLLAREIEQKYFPKGLENPIQRQAFNNLSTLAAMSK